VGAAGVIDHESGTIRAASALFADWAGFPLGPELAQRLGVPVRVENDVNAFLLGEAAAAGPSVPDVLGVMLGTGVGGALVIGGELHHGPHGAAGRPVTWRPWPPGRRSPGGSRSAPGAR
jgi:glucokinase